MIRWSLIVLVVGGFMISNAQCDCWTCSDMEIESH